ncbi:MAG: PhoPQ-activated pathogenicity [Candidatus Hydrogenedentes bacterium]|nr:PhoPQ-activated pathogenicity [Candidatus Hydrogenedentota bacterium]
MPHRKILEKWVLGTLLIGALSVARSAGATALDDYVAEPDPSYSWEFQTTVPGAGYSVHVVRMTSQTWRSIAEVDAPVWKHWVSIIQPAAARYSTAMLYIDGRDNGDGPETGNEELITLALGTSSIVVQLQQVPNQPVTFADETRDREEDELIAYTWDKFLRGGDERWPARLPMTKAAVRAMDTAQAFLASRGVTINDFVVSGASKRGWTTWATAAVDPRVRAIIPMVIDVLNVERSMLHHFAAYGFWAEAIGDYEQMGIMNWMRTPELAALMAIEDPYAYRARYTMPKYMVNATGDQFFLPDSSQFYFSALPGEKYLRYVPNTGHGLDTEALYNVAAYYAAVLNNVARPQFSWVKELDGALRVNAVTPPAQVLLWQATNPESRDFRIETIQSLDVAWTSSPLLPNTDEEYLAQIPVPVRGWTAFMVELTYPSGGELPFKFTTEVSVVPLGLPFGHVEGDVNHSGQMNAVDVQLVINSALGLPGECNCDIDNSQTIDATDVQLGINAALGL